MYEVSFGKVTGPNGEGVPGVITLDKRDGTVPARGYPAFDGTGHWDIAAVTGTDITVEFVCSNGKYQGAVFALSQIGGPTPPSGVTYNPATGEVNLVVPFV